MIIIICSIWYDENGMNEWSVLPRCLTTSLTAGAKKTITYAKIIIILTGRDSKLIHQQFCKQLQGKIRGN